MKGFHKQVLSLVAIVGLVAVAVACGRKGPPFLPGPPFSLVVSHPEAVWKDGVLLVQGEVLPQENQPQPDQTAGCRVFHVRYAFEDAPCEGCPISYQGYREVRGEVVSGQRFDCRLNLQQAPGIYFFEIRLIGPDGRVGPASERVRTVVREVE